MKNVKIGPGEHYVTRRDDELIVTVLGSCVAACIRDPVALVGGVNHFMLPESSTGEWGRASANLRYGNFAMERLVNDILRDGGMRSRLEVKLFGGASLFAMEANVGDQNCGFVEAYVAAEGLKVASAHLRGHFARRIEYAPLTGKVMMLEMKSNNNKVASIEKKFLGAIRNVPSCGSIELFD